MRSSQIPIPLIYSSVMEKLYVREIKTLFLIHEYKM